MQLREKTRREQSDKTKVKETKGRKKGVKSGETTQRDDCLSERFKMKVRNCGLTKNIL